MTPTAPLNLVFDLGQVMIRWEPEALVRRFFPDRCGTDAMPNRWPKLVFALRLGRTLTPAC